MAWGLCPTAAFLFYFYLPFLLSPSPSLCSLAQCFVVCVAWIIEMQRCHCFLTLDRKKKHFPLKALRHINHTANKSKIVLDPNSEDW